MGKFRVGHYAHICWYSVPSKTVSQMTHIPNVTEIQWKQIKLSFKHQNGHKWTAGLIRKRDLE